MIQNWWEAERQVWWIVQSRRKQVWNLVWMYRRCFQIHQTGNQKLEQLEQLEQRKRREQRGQMIGFDFEHGLRKRRAKKQGPVGWYQCFRQTNFLPSPELRCQMHCPSGRSDLLIRRRTSLRFAVELELEESMMSRTGTVVVG